MSVLTAFTTPSGDEMVVLSRADFDALTTAVEDAEDVRLYDLAMQALASGDEELMPFEMVKRLTAGENPVRVWRKHRNLTIAALAASAGISAAYLSQIETGVREGTIGSFKRLAEALNVTVDDLI